MRTFVRVLSDEECSRIHEESLKILSETGVRIDTARGRDVLQRAGALVDEKTNIVRFPNRLVEECLKLAPKDFSLGSRRPEMAIPMNQEVCGIVMDGGAVYTYDTELGARRPATKEDWYLGTRLGDYLDEINVYWSPVEGCWGKSPSETVAYWRAIFKNFSKHVQESTANPEQSRWMLEVLQVVFGSREEFKKSPPVSFILCPASPLIIEAEYTDAYLETLEWGIPVAIMTMPLLGMTSPATLISELILTNCETLAMLCLVQAAAPGTPVIYAAVPVVANMRTGRFGGGEVEHALLGAAVTELARKYQLPVEASACGTDQSIPCIQSGYERALNFSLPILARPDLLVAPGLFGGSTIFSPEQLVIDAEVIRQCRRMSQGIASGAEKWLGEVISTLGTGGNYLAHGSTRRAIRAGELYFSQLGFHDTYEQWIKAGSPDLVRDTHQSIKELLVKHQPLPIPDAIERELERLEMRACSSER